MVIGISSMFSGFLRLRSKSEVPVSFWLECLQKGKWGRRSGQLKLPGGTVCFLEEGRGSVPGEGGGLAPEQGLEDLPLLSSLSPPPIPSCLP